MSIEISIVIPVYNSEESLEKLFNRLSIILRNITAHYEVLLIDDASNDGSFSVLKGLSQKDPRFKVIRLMRNYGQHSAIMCGFNFANGRYIITMDDDLQNPPEEIPKLLSKIKEGYDVVIGRPVEKKHSTYRNFGSYLIGLCFEKIFKKPKNIKMSSFRIIDKQIVDSLVRNKSPYPMIDALLLSHTLNIVNIDVVHHTRQHGKSNYSLVKSLKLSFDLLVNYSTIPLQFISINGFVFAIIGLIIALYAVLGKIFGFINAAGWPSIVALISIFSGIILMSFGMIGEYLIRIIGQVSQLKQYVIRETSSNITGDSTESGEN